MTNVGVIGIGAMGQNHARVYSEIANLVSVVDIDKDALSNISKRYNIEGFNDYHSILKQEDLDAVSICTPTSTHFEIANAFIEAGKHVLVEKPICGDVDKAKALVENAKRNNVIIAAGFIERHNPIVGFIKSLIEKRQFGEIKSISAKRVGLTPSRVKDVGVVLDLGTHEIDVMVYLLSSKVKNVYAFGNNSVGKKFEDHANILLEFTDGISALIEINWLTPVKIRKLSLTCSKNFVEMDYIEQSINIMSLMSKRIDYSNLYSFSQEYEEKKIKVKREEPLKNELIDFLQAIKNKKKPLVSGEDAVNTLEILNGIMCSIKEGRKVEL